MSERHPSGGKGAEEVRAGVVIEDERQREEEKEDWLLFCCCCFYFLPQVFALLPGYKNIV